MLNLTGYVLRMLGLLGIGCGVLVTASVGIGSFNQSEVYAAISRDSQERWIYLLDPERLLKLRILPHVDRSEITNIRDQWAIGLGSLGRFYIQTLERDENGKKLLNVLYLHDVRTGTTSRLIDKPPDLYVGLPIDSPSVASPDGRYISFVDYSRGDLYVLDGQTLEARQVIDISDLGFSYTSNTSTQRVSYSPVWGGLEGRTITYSWDDTLFVWTVGDDQPRTFQFPGKSVGFSSWSGDGKTLLVQSGESSNPDEMFAARIDLETNEVEMVMEDVGRTTWLCGGRFLSYTSLREEDQADSDDETTTSTFMGHLVDTHTGTTFNLDDVPQFTGIDHQYMWMNMYDCDQPESVTIWHQLDNPAPGQNQLYGLPSRLYAFYLLNTRTQELVKIADSAHAIYWRPDLRQYVYYAPGDQDTRVLYTFAPSADAQPIKMGQFRPNHLVVSPLPSNDFEYLVDLENSSSSGFDGRLVRIDMQTGEEVYLTPHNVSVEYPSRWD